MDNLAQTGKLLLEAYQKVQRSKAEQLHCFIGFDGFTDDIVAAVERRFDKENYQRFTTIADFGKKICQAAGVSCNIEFVPLQQKIGGNSAIFALALAENGHALTVAATLGKKEQIEPLFAPLVQKCFEVYPLGPSGHSDAVEFTDGKIILGKIAPLLNLQLSDFLNTVPAPKLIEILEKSALVANGNWTMTPMMNEFWRYLNEEIVPKLSKKPREHAPFFFVDLADPAKRSDEDLNFALEELKKLNRYYKVILGLNKSEAKRVAFTALKEQPTELSDQQEALQLAKKLQNKLELHTLLLHCSSWAAAAAPDEAEAVDTFYCSHPALTTGAGDHFNAGFCHGLLYRLPLKSCLTTAVATGGYYVRFGATPTIENLATFLSEQYSTSNR